MFKELNNCMLCWEHALGEGWLRYTRRTSYGARGATHMGLVGAAVPGSSAWSSRGLVRECWDGPSAGTQDTADSQVPKTLWRSVVLGGPVGSAQTPVVRGAPDAWCPWRPVTGSCILYLQSPALPGVCFLRVAVTVNSLGCSPPVSPQEHQTRSALIYWSCAWCQVKAVILAACLVCP